MAITADDLDAQTIFFVLMASASSRVTAAATRIGRGRPTFE
jgi:hypothetical protein